MPAAFAAATTPAASLSAESREMFGEGDRWRTLEQLHRKQRKALGDAGLQDVNDARRIVAQVATPCRDVRAAVRQGLA